MMTVIGYILIFMVVFMVGGLFGFFIACLLATAGKQNNLEEAYKQGSCFGYNIACQGLNEKIDDMIEEIHRAYMFNTNESAKSRLDAQMKILWDFKDKIENAMIDI